MSYIIDKVMSDKETVTNPNNKGTASYKGFILNLAETKGSKALVAVDLNKTVQLYIVEANNHLAANIRHKTGTETLYSFNFKNNYWQDSNNRPVTSESVESHLKLTGLGDFIKFFNKVQK